MISNWAHTDHDAIMVPRYLLMSSLMRQLDGKHHNQVRGFETGRDKLCWFVHYQYVVLKRRKVNEILHGKKTLSTLGPAMVHGIPRGFQFGDPGISRAYLVCIIRYTYLCTYGQLYHPNNDTLSSADQYLPTHESNTGRNCIWPSAVPPGRHPSHDGILSQLPAACSITNPFYSLHSHFIPAGVRSF